MKAASQSVAAMLRKAAIFFRDKEVAELFKSSLYEVGAQLSAIAVTAGVGKSGNYTDGVAIFILPKAGIMAEMSVTGQRIAFERF